VIVVGCECGKKYRLGSGLIGKKVRCKACGSVIRVDLELEPELARPSLAAEPQRALGAAHSDVRRGQAPRRRRRRTTSGTRPAVGRKVGVVAGVSVAALLLLFGGGIAAAVTGWRPWQRDLLAHVPQDMDVVMKVDCARMIDELGQDPDVAQALAKHVQDKGVSADGDLDELVLAMDFDPEANEVHMLVLLRGDLDAAELEEAVFEGRELKTKDYKGHTLRVAEGTFGNLGLQTDLGYTYLEGGVLAVGDEVALRRTVDTAEGAPSILDNARMRELIDRGQDSIVFCAVDLPEEMTADADGVEDMLVRIDHRDRVLTIGVDVGYDDAEHAREAQQQVEEAVASLTKPDEGELDALSMISAMWGVEVDMDSLVLGKSIERNGDDLRIEVRLDSDEILRVGKALEDQAQAMQTELGGN
jgi:hypothetical protein